MRFCVLVMATYPLESTAPITSKNVHRHQADQETIRHASELLSAYGFKVEPAGSFGLSLSGDKALFERIFQTRLAPRKGSDTESIPLGGTGIMYEAQSPFKIPEDLSSYIAFVTLPIPPELFSINHMIYAEKSGNIISKL